MLLPIHQTTEAFDEISSWSPLPPKLIGTHVFLTAFDPDQSNEILRFMTDETVATGLGDHLYKAMTRQEEKDNLSRWGCNPEDGYSMFVWDIADQKVIGTCCLFDIHPVNRSADISINIGDRVYQRKGRATEALTLMLSYAFKTLNLHSVQLEVFEYNEGAIQCYRKLGFTESGKRRDARWVQGRYWDVIYMDILDREWLNSEPSK